MLNRRSFLKLTALSPLLGVASKSDTPDEIEEEVKTLQVSRICPKCCKGRMMFAGGGVLMTYPAQYPHKCDKCGHDEYYSGTMYPYTKYELINA